MPGFLKSMVVAAAGALSLAAASWATSHGPLPAHTGAFGEPTCQRCHAEYPLNDGSAHITLDSLPAAYEPEASHVLRLRVQHSQLRRAGFQLTARFEDGTQAGVFAIADTSVLKLQRAAGIEYLSHNSAGTYALRGDTAEWRFGWNAPASDRRVVFHVAVNVANDDASEFGDRIFTASFRTGGEPIRK